MANEQTTVPLFAAAEILTAVDMNLSAGTGVPVFSNSTTRDAAFGGAGEKVLAEGQLCYLSSTNVVQYYDGAAWATVGPSAGGKMAQVNNASTGTDTTNSTTTYADTTLTATITPTSATSKVLVFVSQNVGKNTGNTDSYAWLRLLRGATELIVFSVGPYTGTSLYVLGVSGTTTYLDSPATTSATTYKTQMKNNVAADGSRTQWQSSSSTITLIEVLA